MVVVVVWSVIRIEPYRDSKEARESEREREKIASYGGGKSREKERGE